MAGFQAPPDSGGSNGADPRTHSGQLYNVSDHVPKMTTRLYRHHDSIIKPDPPTYLYLSKLSGQGHLSLQFGYTTTTLYFWH